MIKSRGKDAHMIHEELVQAMKWKQTVLNDPLPFYTFKQCVLINDFFVAWKILFTT